MADVPASRALLPHGVERLTLGPQGLVVIWSRRAVPGLVERLHSTGRLPVLLAPAETAPMVELAGRLEGLLVDPDLLDADGLATLESLRADHPRVRLVLLASGDSSRSGLLAAMRIGLTEVIDPDDAARVEDLFPHEQDQAGERVLAIGAHPDDVEIGCGATLLRHRDLGHVVSVLTLSRGAVGGPQSERTREAAGAATQMGAELLLADLTDTRIGDEPDLIPMIEGVLAAVRPTTVYVHSAHDNHQDHRAVHEAAIVAARRVPQVFCYQSPSSRNAFAPTRFTPVDTTVEEKVRLLGHYRSQSTRHYLEPDLVRATTRYWARQLTHVRHVEPFEVMRASGESLG